MAAHAGVAHTTERQRRGCLGGHDVVDGYPADAQRPGHPARPIHVRTPHGAGQPEQRVIRPVDGLPLGAEAQHRDHRPEGLLRDDQRVLRHVDQQDRRDQRGTAVPVLAGELAGTARQCVLNLLVDSLDLEVDGHAAQVVVAGVRVRLREQPGLPDQLRDELLLDALVDVEPLHRRAGLARRRQTAEQCARGGAGDVDVLKNDHGVLATELELDRNEHVGALLHDLPAGRARAGEHDEVGVLVDDIRAHGTVAVDHLHPVRGDGGFLHEGFDQPGQRGVLGGLVDDRVAGGQCGDDRHDGLEEGVVPGRDHEGHAEWFVPDLGLLAHHRQRGLDLLRGQDLRGVLFVPADDVQRAEHFGHEDVAAGLARFLPDAVDDLLGAVDDHTAQEAEVFEPFLDAQGTDGFLCFACPVDDALDLGVFGLWDLCCHGVCSLWFLSAG